MTHRSVMDHKDHVMDEKDYAMNRYTRDGDDTFLRIEHDDALQGLPSQTDLLECLRKKKEPMKTNPQPPPAMNVNLPPNFQPTEAQKLAFMKSLGITPEGLTQFQQEKMELVQRLNSTDCQRRLKRAGQDITPQKKKQRVPTWDVLPNETPEQSVEAYRQALMKKFQHVDCQANNDRTPVDSYTGVADAKNIKTQQIHSSPPVDSILASWMPVIPQHLLTQPDDEERVFSDLVGAPIVENFDTDMDEETEPELISCHQ